MNVSELKNLKINELTQMAKKLKIEGYAGMRKQELIFTLLQAQIEKNGLIYGEGTLEILPDGSGFSRPELIITCPDPMTSMSRPPRSGGSTFEPATPFQARFDSPRSLNAILPCSRSKPSTTRTRRSPAKRSFSTT
jgi:hypothetical protein